jgi:isochorismate hydrolase
MVLDKLHLKVSDYMTLNPVSVNPGHKAIDAFIRGYKIIVPEDGVTSFKESDHKAALDYMKTNYGAKIIKMSELIDLISK